MAFSISPKLNLFCPILINGQQEHLLIRGFSSLVTDDIFVYRSCQSDWRLFKSGVIPCTNLLLCNWILSIPVIETPEDKNAAMYISEWASDINWRRPQV